MNANRWDAIVVGTGGVGSAALLHLARRGLRVVGIDRFPGGHDRGSSHGQTRIIREAYAEHPAYVPLVRRAYELWEELEQSVGERLYWETGLLEVGPPGGLILPGVRRSAREHQLRIEELTAAEARRRYPQFRIGEAMEAIVETRAGVLLVEQCVRAHLEAARRAGAQLAICESVCEWRVDGSGVRVATDRQTYHAARLVVAAGAWSAQVVGRLGPSLQVLRKHLHWFASDQPAYRLDGNCPAFLYELPEGIFYGMPQMDERGVKIAEHTGGEPVADPLQVDRQADPRDRERVERALRACLPGVSGPATDHAVCMYTMSPDAHFLVDRHPDHPQVVLAAGLSGHGFKFTSALGELLADLALGSSPRVPADFFRLERLAAGES